MEAWITHLLSALGGGTVLTVITQFILRYRRQSVDSWQLLLSTGNSRIAALENRLDTMHAENTARVDRMHRENTAMIDQARIDHVKCLESHADLRVKVAVLEQTALKLQGP